MRLFLLSLLEFAYALLAVPKMASVSLRDMRGRDRIAVVWAATAAVSFSTGLFYLRDSYSASFLALVPFLSAVVYVFNRSYSHLLAARVLAGPLPERAERGLLTAFFEGSCIPGVFFLPLSITAREFSHPGMVLLPGFLAITAWIVYIQYTGLVYALEIEPRRAMLLLVRHHAVLVLFPAVSVYFYGTILVSLVGVKTGF